MKNLIYSLSAVLLLLTISCSEDNPLIEQVDAPIFALANNAIEVDFLTEGVLQAPSIRWSGEEGTFEISPAITGISVNALTGVISYNKTIPIGETTLSLIAKNSAGQAVQQVVINNLFFGSFNGEYTNGDNDNFGRTHKSVYNKDGTYTGEDNGNTSSNTTGTWSINGDVLTASYRYGDTAGSDYIFETTLKYSPEGATLDGAWYFFDSFGGFARFTSD